MTKGFRWHWTLLGLSGLFGLVGCSSVQIVGSGGGTQAIVGPVVLEAWSGNQRMKKFERDGAIHIVGQTGQRFALSLKNRTEHIWKVVVRVGEQSSSKTIATLGPYMRLPLRRVGMGKKASDFSMPASGKALEKVNFVKLSLYPEQKEDYAVSRVTAGMYRRFSAKASHEITLSYGLCEGYKSRSLYSKWCPAAPRGFFVPPARPFPEPYVKGTR